jgi:hypothetical protein
VTAAHVMKGVRGLATPGVVSLTGDVHPLRVLSNRGMCSLALALATQDGIDILAELGIDWDTIVNHRGRSIVR